MAGFVEQNANVGKLGDCSGRGKGLAVALWASLVWLEDWKWSQEARESPNSVLKYLNCSPKNTVRSSVPKTGFLNEQKTLTKPHPIPVFSLFRGERAWHSLWPSTPSSSLRALGRDLHRRDRAAVRFIRVPSTAAADGRRWREFVT